MPLGYNNEPRLINMGDSAELIADIFIDEKPYEDGDLLSVEFEVQKPDLTHQTVTGVIQDDGSGYGIFDDTDQEGKYITIARFTTIDGLVKSTRVDFQVQDPFATNPTVQSVIDEVWNRFQDCFDSELGGPWLRDRTLMTFEPRDIANRIPEAMVLINVTGPPTELTASYFTTPDNDGNPNPSQELLVAFTYIATIKHLMRSYTEQPDIKGANVVYEDRRDYLQRWQLIYQMEWDYWLKALMLWKRQFLNLGHSSLLVSNKAGRLLGPGMKSRNIGRGWWY